jgi:hypothetical protein
MKRREFLTAGGAGLAALAMTSTATAQNNRRLQGSFGRRQPTTPRQFIELRFYTARDAEKRDQLVEILDKAFIPALNRQGLRPVGVFVPIKRETPIEREAKYALNVFVAIPHRTVETFVNVNARLLADRTYMRNAAPIFETTSSESIYTDCDTSFLQCFETAPALETIPLNPERVFEWRLYRSFNIERNAAKVHMFDHGGELPLFREIGLNPIFFGDMIAGKRMPAFEYIVGSPSLEALNESWRVFRDHPKWLAMRDLPEYADTATEIERIVLTPSPGSQI